MPKSILYHLHINAGFNHPRCECVPEIVAAEMRKQNLRILVFQELCIIAVPNDTAERFIQGTLMLGLSKAVHKDKIRIPVDRDVAFDPGLFLIPFISALLPWLSMKISTATNPQMAQDSQAAATTKSMNMMMPLMSVWICFIMPAAMGIYWIANSVFGIARDYILTKVFKKQLDIEDAERKAARDAREWEIERQHEETERLRAEGKTEKNVNTSKKKIQANEKQKSDERKAALERAERAERRERLGVKEAEKPASQVGNRRYARGRAYVPDRFTNPENAEEATAAAALASEDGASIDETVEETELAAETVNEAVETAEAAVEAAAESAEE